MGSLLLWTAVGLVLLHTAGHVMGMLTWKKSTDSIRSNVVQSMTEHKFPFMGANRSLANSFDGFGHAATLALLFVAFILGLSALNFHQNNEILKPLLGATATFLLGFGIDEIIFFFPLAAVLSLGSSLLTFAALWALR